MFAQLVPQIAEAVATTASGPEAARRATALSTYGPSAIDAVRSHLEVRASRERTTPLGELHLLKILEDHAARTTREQ